MNLIAMLKDKNYADLRTYLREKYVNVLANRINNKKEEFLAELKKT